jgi:RNA polymerase sigma-70 factor (ECF subfamily)
MSDEWVTRKSLLLRVRDSDDEQAWTDFVAFYENFIYHILYCLNINTTDADDLVQDILLKLWKNLKTYDPEKGRFRIWLNRVVRNAAYNFFDTVKRQRQLLESEQQFAEILQTMSSDDMENLIQAEWSNYITSYALNRLKDIFSGQAINVFSMSLDGLSADDIAKELNLTRDSVYTLKNRVKARFIKEVHALVREFEGEDSTSHG